MEIKLLENQNKFIASKEGQNLGELTFEVNGETINFNHTFVDPEARGLGVGQALVEAGAKMAKDKGQKVKASCWYAKKVFEKSYPHLLS